jgi:hypothetical protein
METIELGGAAARDRRALDVQPQSRGERGYLER